MTEIKTLKKNNLIWMDLEMTGLNPEFDSIIEIATLITDNNLNILAEGPVIAIHQNEDELKKMNDWNRYTHSKSGLLDRVEKSNYNNEAAENETLEFFKKWVDSNSSPICGNSIAQDRRFLFKYMPILESYFHYRYIDVSTLKELIYRWKPEILLGFKKVYHHRALDDIRESIAELIYYRQHILLI